MGRTAYTIDEYRKLPKKATGVRRTAIPGIKPLMSVDEFNASGHGKEDALQISCINWFKLKYPKLMIRGSMNGADLVGGGKEWNHLVRMGAINGEADLHIIVPSGEFHSLFIEMKRLKGKQRASQIKFEQDALAKGHGYAIAKTRKQFERVVNSYLESGCY